MILTHTTGGRVLFKTRKSRMSRTRRGCSRWDNMLGPHEYNCRKQVYKAVRPEFHEESFQVISQLKRRKIAMLGLLC